MNKKISDIRHYQFCLSNWNKLQPGQLIFLSKNNLEKVVMTSIGLQCDVYSSLFKYKLSENSVSDANYVVTPIGGRHCSTTKEIDLVGCSAATRNSDWSLCV